MKTIPNETEDKFSFLFFESKLSNPKFFEIKKSYAKLFFYVFPILLITSISLLIIGLVYFKEIREVVKRKEPQIIKELKSENQSLIQKEKEFLKEQALLEKKLLGEPTSDLASLSLFRPVKGQTDKTHTPQISLDNFSANNESGQITVKFLMTNLNSEIDKQSGYIFVLIKSGEGLYYYPPSAIPEDDVQFQFNKGEYFAFSRFRPVKLQIRTTEKKNDFMVKVLIFSRQGDLIHKKIFSRSEG